MPIPPPAVYSRSNLSRQQKQEALAACYGVTMPTQTQPLTELEVAHMRTLLAQHDSSSKKVTIHDLNNPPREQYRFQKFPMMVYDLTNSHPSHDEQRPKANSLGMETVHVPAKVVSVLVHSEEQLQHALSEGWSQEAPTYTEEREEVLSPKYANEVARVDAVIEQGRQKRAYNRKVA